jgi:transcription initiation factor TFIID subunit 7
MFKIKIKPPKPPGEDPVAQPTQAHTSPAVPDAADGSHISTEPGSVPPIKLKRFNIKKPVQQKLRIKQKVNPSKIVLRKTFTVGHGYDSEASDREEDPLVETHMILRFKPGPEADYVRSKIEAKGPMEGISIKFKEPRKAVVRVQNKLFAAKLVDLPTITETYKTFDKKNIYKVADVCQMLLVGDRISHEDTVTAMPTQPKDFTFPHGLTPPLRYVRQRRFRKRASAKTIETVEKEVDRLLALDARAEQTTYTIMDKGQLLRDQSQTPTEGSQRDEYEEVDEAVEMQEASDYEDLAAELEAALDSPAASGYGTPMLRDASVPAGGVTPSAAGSVSDQGSSDGSDVGSEDEDATKEQIERKTGQKVLREGVASLQEVIANQKAEIERAINPIMKQRLITRLRKFEAELETKLAEMEEA